MTTATIDRTEFTATIDRTEFTAPDGTVLGVRIGDRLFEHCARCYGSGHYSYNPLDGTRCYGCNGRGYGREIDEADALRRYNNRQKAAARRARRAENAAAAKQAAMTEWKNAHRELVDALRPFQTGDLDQPIRNRFLNQLAEQVYGTLNPLSDRQVDAALRALAQQAERDAQRAERNTAQAAAGHLGSVGEKVELSVTILQKREIESEYSGHLRISYLVKMLDDHGHVLTTFSSGTFAYEVEVNDRVTVKGTVKAHASYHDLPETQLTRVKVVA